MDKSRKNKKKELLINALTEAQKIAFAPLTFQAVASLIELGILKEIDKKEITKEEIIKNLDLDEYTVGTLLEAGEVIGAVELKENMYSITKLGQTFLYDEMTRVNFYFVKDVCYNGARFLTDSFKGKSPCGLKQLYPDAKTLYPYLPSLPYNMKKSWYEFDHYYSDNCFYKIYEIIKEYKKTFDIGGNLGAFEKICLKNNPDFNITMIDLPQNIDSIQNDPELSNCKFYRTDILDETVPLPNMSGAIVMSQFLDCFSKEKIKFILKRIKKCSEKGTKLFILEPFIDNQKFFGAKYSLVHTSLYFTCIANGYSKMYSKEDMKNILYEMGIKIIKEYEQIGINDYTLLECTVDD